MNPKMLRKANSLRKRWRPRSKKKNDDSKDETSESSLLREDVRDDVGTDSEQRDYEEKLRTMREELNTKYSEMIEGMKKREASNTLRMNTKLACIAKQRDEMETKLHLVEKKYRNMKKKMSAMDSSSTTSGSETATKDTRSPDNDPSISVSINRQDQEMDKDRGRTTVEAGPDVRPLETWFKGVNQILNEIRQDMAGMRNIVSGMNANFRRFFELNVGEKVIALLYQDERLRIEREAGEFKEKLQHQNQNSEVKANNSVDGDKNILMRKSKTESEEAKCDFIPMEPNEYSRSSKKGNANGINQQFVFTNEVSEFVDGGENRDLEHYTNVDKLEEESCERVFEESLGNRSTNHGNFPNANSEEEREDHETSKGKLDLPFYSKPDPSDRHVHSDATLDFMGDSSVEEEYVSQHNAEGNSDGTILNMRDLAAEVTRQLEQPLTYFLSRYQQLSQEITLNDWRRREVLVDKGGFPSFTDRGPSNSTTYDTRAPSRDCPCNKPCYCCDTSCKVYKEQRSGTRTEQCSRCLNSGNYAASCIEIPRMCRTEPCGKYQHSHFPRNFDGGVRGDGYCCSDYVQRHIVRSSAIIANLRDLKPDEEWDY